MMRNTKRIIDANANRAREALRVLEESARFLLDDTTLSAQLKSLRHELAHNLAIIPGLIYHRDTPGDVGTDITTPAEQQRDGPLDVVNAAAARLSEALRVIEEYAKTLNDDTAAPQLATTAEQLRYKSYDLCRQLRLALGSGRGCQWRLCLLLTESLCVHHTWQRVLEQAIDSGVDCVQVREKNMDSGDLLHRVREVIGLVAGKAAVIVNDRPDIALLAQADGVHLGQTDLNPNEARKLAGDRLIIGVSTSGLDQAKQAKALGADYCGVGPMFATTTKHKPTLAGPDYLQQFLGWGRLPHLAIGGINPDNISQLTALGCRGVAVSSTICAAQDPASVTASLRGALDHTAAQQQQHQQ